MAFNWRASAAGARLLLGASGMAMVVSIGTAPPDVTPGPNETIYYGTTNTTGQAPYDTGDGALSGNSTPAGFSATAGVITSVSTPATGTYTIGEWTIEVDTAHHAVGNQAGWDALGGSHYGKTIVVRQKADIIWSGGWGSNSDMLNTVVTGDGGDPRLAYASVSDNVNRHFDYIVLNKHRNVQLDGLFVQPTTKHTVIELQGGYDITSGTTLENVEIVRCVVKGSDPDPHGDYTAGTSAFPGENGIFSQLNFQYGFISIRDNVVYGVNYGIRLPANVRAMELIGNLIDMSFQDAMQVGHSSDTPALIAGNYVTRMMSIPSDTGNPHGDVLQITTSPSFDTNIVIDCNYHFVGNSRGYNGLQVWYISDDGGGGVSLLMRGCGSQDASARSISIHLGNGVLVERCGAIAGDWLAFPHNNNTTSMTLSSHANGGNVFDDSFSGNMDAGGGGLDRSTSVDFRSWSEAALTAALPAHPLSRAQTLTLPEFMAKFAVQGALAGKGPHGVSSLAVGAELSSYTTDDTIVPTPVLTNLSTPAGTTSFTATVRTNVQLNPIFWAIVPAATTVTDPREIKKRTIAGALDYGWSTVLKGQGDGATDIAIAGAAGALSGGTSYKLVCYQENGWSKASAVSTAAFTTS